MKRIMLVLSLVLAAGIAHAQDVPVWRTVPQPAPLPAADESGLAAVNDIRMWYAIFNKGGPDPVILLHGGLGNSGNWGNQVPALVGRHEVIVADSRGHGRSTRSGQPYSYGLMASDVLALMDALKIDRAAIVGWSDGGIIGLDIAIHHPERLTELYAYGANYNLSGVKDTVMTDPVFGAAVEQQIAAYKAISPTPDDFDSFMNAIVAMWMTQPDYTPEELGAIMTPTMIADGEHDEAIKREHTEEMAGLIPGAKLEILPGVSHMGMWQDPDLFNRSMVGFIDGP
jgi:pimeloyl-ACP methyl ester carboxylesterase